MRTQSQFSSEEFSLEIRRGRIAELSIYEVSEAELNTLALGGAGSVYLTFCVFLLSVAIAFTIALQSTPIPPGHTYTFFMASTIIGYIGGFLMLLLWIRQFRAASRVVGIIRSRLAPSGDAENLSTNPTLPENPQMHFLLISAHYGTTQHQLDVTDHVAAMVTSAASQKFHIGIWQSEGYRNTLG